MYFVCLGILWLLIDFLFKGELTREIGIIFWWLIAATFTIIYIFLFAIYPDWNWVDFNFNFNIHSIIKHLTPKW